MLFISKLYFEIPGLFLSPSAHPCYFPSVVTGADVVLKV